MRNIVKAILKRGSIKTVTRPLFQYDIGQLIEISGDIPGTCRADLANDWDEICLYSQDIEPVDGVALVSIPDELLRTGKSIICYITEFGDDFGSTEYAIRIPVIRRPKPEELEETEEEES